jgi:hypothetical protein
MAIEINFVIRIGGGRKKKYQIRTINQGLRVKINQLQSL